MDPSFASMYIRNGVKCPKCNGRITSFHSYKDYYITLLPAGSRRRSFGMVLVCGKCGRETKVNESQFDDCNFS
jgi:DNA-directed RNA polymerase subunit RPC12/RpoP